MDEETAINDIVKDYKNGGNNLINIYEKNRAEVITANNAKLDNLRHQLAASFDKVQVGLAKISKEMRRRHVTDFERQWQSEQQGLMMNLKAVLAGCAE